MGSKWSPVRGDSFAHSGGLRPTFFRGIERPCPARRASRPLVAGTEWHDAGVDPPQKTRCPLKHPTSRLLTLHIRNAKCCMQLVDAASRLTLPSGKATPPAHSCRRDGGHPVPSSAWRKGNRHDETRPRRPEAAAALLSVDGKGRRLLHEAFRPPPHHLPPPGHDARRHPNHRFERSSAAWKLVSPSEQLRAPRGVVYALGEESASCARSRFLRQRTR